MSAAPDRMAEIRAALASVPAPPWQWIGDTKHSGPMLATKHSGWIYVMGFKRLGTQGAQPAFPVKDVNGYLVITPCRDIENRDRTTVAAKNAAIPRASYDPDTVRGIDNPVAQWIEHSPQYVAELLTEVERLNGELAAARKDAAKWAAVELTIRRAADHGHDAYTELLDLAEPTTAGEVSGG